MHVHIHVHVLHAELVILIEHTMPHLLVECMLPIQGSPQADIEAERVGMVWAEFVRTSIEPTVKAEWAPLPNGPGENTANPLLYSSLY